MAHHGPHPGPRMPVSVATHCGRVSLYRLRGRSIVILTGEIDVAFRDEPFVDLVTAVRTAGGPVHVDCSGVTFFGAEGLRMLGALACAAVDHRLASVVTSRSVDLLAEAFGPGGYRLTA